MSRRPNNANTGVSLFPFLAVLLCTMGSLVLLLMLIASQTKAQAEAERAAAAKPKVDHEAIRRREEDLQWKIDQLSKSRDKTQADVAEQRSQLSHLEEHALRLKKQLADLEAAEALLKSQAAGDVAGRGALQADLDELRRKIAEAEKKLAAEKAVGRKPQAFAVVPYDGDKGTRRRPIYIECRGDSIVLQPEGIQFLESDFAGSLGPSNPLATAVRLTSEYLTRGETYRDGEQPYPLLLVRPSGVGSYYAARAGMSSWEGEFGYELIDENWPLEFPPADPLLNQMLVKAVEEARVRQVMLARAAPSIRSKGPKATFRVSPSGGGIVQEGGGGGGYGAPRGSRYTADRGGPRGGRQGPSGGGGYSSSRPAEDKFATVNGGGNGGYSAGPAGAAPGADGNPLGGPGFNAGPDGSGDPNGNMVAAAPTINGNGVTTGGGLGSGGTGTGSAGFGPGGSENSGSGNGGSGDGTLADNRNGNVAQAGGDRYGSGSTVGDRYSSPSGGYPGQPTAVGGPSLGSPTGMSGAGNAPGSNSATSYAGGGGSPSANDPNMVSASSRIGGSAAGQPGDGGFSNGYSSARSTGDAQASNGQPSDGFGGPGGSELSGGTNTSPSGAAGANSGGSSTSSGVAGTGSAGGPQMGGQPGGSSGGGSPLPFSVGSAGAGQPGGGSSPGGDPSSAQNTNGTQQVPPPGPGEYVESMASKRGKNWGLPEEARRSTPLTRPIQLYCSGNQLTLFSDKGIPDKQIIMEGPTENSVDTLVSNVWDQVTTWGIAGRGMYWKPKLVVHVAPDGAQRFNDLKQLLDGSGLEVSGKQIAVAQPIGGRR